LVVYGPRGSGKSTLLHEIGARLTKERVPVGRAEATRRLDDITAALERAYPGVETTAVTRRAARTRLRAAADRCGGVLLLDHLTEVSTAMVGYLRRLRGGLVGVLMAVDVDAERDRERVRQWHIGLSERMPDISTRQLRNLLRSRFEMLHVAPIPLDIERHIVRSARGRPGWIEKCAELAREPRYWRDDKLFAALLCIDSEIELRRTIDR
jgi:Cdc6-like AAA superfamily ATPase